MNNVLFNQWGKLKYFNPREELIELRRVEILPQRFQLNEKDRALRGNKYSKCRQFRQAALLCYGIGECVLKTKIGFSPFEDSDFDFISIHKENDCAYYSRIQLKEVVPDYINPNASIEKVLEGLKKYNSRDLTVGIHVNQRISLKINEIKVPKLNISGIWLFGSKDEFQVKWFLCGNLLKDPNVYEFSYPIQ
ncbi:hypothetical protein KAR91_69020 [Candidatus Pacearchaeota archaeon]|nr:hypothetical protein [Candidatus Pacearchaeota archaeon]